MPKLTKKNVNEKTDNSVNSTARRQTVTGRKSPPTITKAPGNLDASVITEPLDSLISALGNKIEREWPARFANIQGARELFLLTLRIADVTSRSIRWSAEQPRDPARIPE